MSNLFNKLYFQLLTVPKNHEVYCKTLNNCLNDIIRYTVEIMCKYSPQASEFYKYLEKYYIQNYIAQL